MKVKQLIALLSNADPEDNVCVFTEGGPEELERAVVYVGDYCVDNAPKLTWRHETGRFVGLGNPGDFEITEEYEHCKPVFDLERNEAID